MKFMPSPRRSDRGIYLMELMVSITMLSVMVLGLTTVLIVQARQTARDKILNDLYYYADMILNEASSSFGAAREVQRNANSGGSVVQDLEFQMLGITNNGRTLETSFTREGERKVIIRNNGRRPDFIDRFPPPELDPNRHMNLKYRVRVKDFRIGAYLDRPFINTRVRNIMSQVVLTLELEDVDAGYSIQREFRRVICTPNKHISDNRLSSSTQGS